MEASILPRYMTQQRKLLLAYLQAHEDELLCAGEIADALAQQGVSASAVYRNLAALAQEGAIQSVSKSGSRRGYYRFSANSHCRDHLHLSCKQCGKTFHMDTQESEQLIRSIAQQEHFAIDQTDTVLYGVCASCQARNSGSQED